MSVRRGEEKAPRLGRRFFLLTAAVVFLLDQFTKSLALHFLLPRVSLPVIPPVFHLTLVQNQGIAFGLFQGFDAALLGAITASIGLLVFLGLRSDPLRFTHRWGIGLILGGAVGNWADRIRLGAVVDFLDFRIWPVFNLADTAITVGVALFLLELLKGKSRVS